ncbi:hypothetical protein [Actinoallomurus iriomotensis]|uniref:Uncharacterized protein n=1 Tax=Actinoallomurus iriomotensis TaxID=478107 RepID=A0A9W6RKH9_9ACTN|nr:hypothetical protein [Actinoallomurus iriomotensis]GLY75677.1 hypothetical protein Airi01_039440 [Actinoallomurus iriomotensis]
MPLPRPCESPQEPESSRSPLLRLLTLDGTLSVLGRAGEIPLRIMDLIYGRKKPTSSGTGGRAGTSQMPAFCAEHGITADIELLPPPVSRRLSPAWTRATSATASC